MESKPVNTSKPLTASSEAILYGSQNDDFITFAFVNLVNNWRANYTIDSFILHALSPGFDSSIIFIGTYRQYFRLHIIRVIDFLFRSFVTVKNKCWNGIFSPDQKCCQSKSRHFNQKLQLESKLSNDQHSLMSSYNKLCACLKPEILSNKNETPANCSQISFIQKGGKCWKKKMLKKCTYFFWNEKLFCSHCRKIRMA